MTVHRFVRGGTWAPEAPRWLRRADIEWCEYEVVDGVLHWRDGIWYGGTWHDGIWYGGTWHDGTWDRGAWYGGTWYRGDWGAGTWYRGTWHGGDWCDGSWRGGDWRGGDWHAGNWRGGERVGTFPAALVGWTGHGEQGRTLRGWICPRRGLRFTCGCFTGDLAELHAYIAAGPERLRESRTRALRIVLDLLDQTPNEVGRRYRHAKGGVYRVVGEATHTETKEGLVVYVSDADGRLWARPRAMFMDGRFELLGGEQWPAGEYPTITSEDRAALASLVEALHTQHNDHTSDPVFLVQKKVVTSGFDPQYTDDIRWVDSDGEFAAADEHARLEAAYQESHDEPDGWTRTGVQETWETVQPFLTRKAAEQYLESNAHRLGEGARVYTDSAYRNYELQLLRRTLPLLVRRVAALETQIEMEYPPHWTAKP